MIHNEIEGSQYGLTLIEAMFIFLYFQNIFQGAMSLDQLYITRPTAKYSDYRSPIKGLYLCGSGAHPGGGVMGAPGRLAAMTVLSDIK